MNKNKNKKIKTNGGAAMMILVIFFMFISLAILITLTTPVIREFRIATNNLNSKQAYFLSESGVEDIIYRMKNNKKYNSNETLVLGTSSATTSVTDISNNQKEIVSLGDKNSNERKVKINLTTGAGVSFNYGVQVGQGGLFLKWGGKVDGSVYANGPIIGDGSSIITGTAISANSPASTSSQSNGIGQPAHNIIFAKYFSSQDIAQSFKLTKNGSINKVQLYIKKIGNPSNLTIRIVDDFYGSPGYRTLTSGQLSASKITSSYGWVNVSFNNSSTLSANKTYWLIVDGYPSRRSYYEIGASDGGYSNGVARIGQYFWGYWKNTNPPGLDYYFGIYVGGATGLITSNYGSIWNRFRVGTTLGSAQAHTVNYTNATGKIYCQSGTGNNKSCTSQPDPTYIAMPVSTANITDWENGASSGGTYNGNYYVGWSGATLGPKKINGNLIISNGGTLTITGNLWVTGDIIFKGYGKIKLSPSYGSNDGVIIANGKISISYGSSVLGSGVNGSYLMMLSTGSSNDAIKVSGGVGALVVYASNGGIEITGGTSLKEAVGYKVFISGASTINYDSGLSNSNFSTGPSGSWNINSWEEVK